MCTYCVTSACAPSRLVTPTIRNSHNRNTFGPKIKTSYSNQLRFHSELDGIRVNPDKRIKHYFVPYTFSPAHHRTRELLRRPRDSRLQHRRRRRRRRPEKCFMFRGFKIPLSEDFPFNARPKGREHGFCEAGVVVKGYPPAASIRCEEIIVFVW